MYDYLKIIRPKYLIFVFALQYLVYQNVLKAILQMHGIGFQPDEPSMYLVFAATSLILAGGFVLNDYFDVKIDAINRPDKLLITRAIPREKAMLFYQILTGAGVVAGLAFAFLLKNFTLAFIFIVVPGVLWFYSASYKRQLILGNAAAAFCAALAVLTVTIGYAVIIEREVGALFFQTAIPHDFYAFTGAFAAFIFLNTWILNVLKDFRNEYGDREMESRTMVIKWGAAKAKIFVIALIIIEIMLLFMFNGFLNIDDNYLTLKYFSILLIVPLIVLIYLIIKAKCMTEYAQAQFLLNIVTVSGILYSFVLTYLLAKTYNFALYGKFIIN
ncbi:MAG: UbiA family prenyltransferase [Paludibacter sp.]|jgi:4-hydroxybenzoate polyprenyltransferase|nr:UbiA family prenyltransferase [Paludibacter sp.]